MGELNKSLNLLEALNELDNISKSFKFDVWIPSLYSYVSFKPLDGKQQKDLLGAAMDTAVYNISFIKTFYNIIKDNILVDDKSIVDSFNIADKASIALYLRSKVSDTINVFFDDKNETVKDIDIQPILDGFKNYTTPTQETFSIKDENYQLDVTIKYPSIKIEYDYDTTFKENKKPEDVKTTQDVQKIVTTAFIGETCKYIDSVVINGQEVSIHILSFADKIKLIERLPSNIIQKIVQKISEWKKSLDEILTVSSEGHTQIIEINSLLFLN